MTRKPILPDAGLWDIVAAGVRPLKGGAKKAPPAPKAVKKGVKVQVQDASPRPRATPAPALDGGMQKKLKRGKAEIEGRLDLHGMRLAEAEKALMRFISASFRAGKRMLLVITGKGSLKEGGGILRREIPELLRRDARVSGISEAAARDGGSGAFYVRLKKQG